MYYYYFLTNKNENIEMKHDYGTKNKYAEQNFKARKKVSLPEILFLAVFPVHTDSSVVIFFQFILTVQ